MATEKNKSKGFTLVEVVISISIFVVLSFLAVQLLMDVFKIPNQQAMSSGNIDYVRSITNNFINELRNASTGNDGSYSLGQASDTQIIFYSTYQSSGVAKRIRYYISGNNLYKGVVSPTGSPLSYNLNTEKVTTLINDLANGNAPVFYYYDGGFSGSGSALSQPVNINLIKFVKINLLIKKLTTAQTQEVFSINAGATIRNLKNNLGN